MLTGRRITAEEGQRLGFVNHVTDGDVIDSARRYADEILACSPMSVRATKEAVLKSLAMPVKEAVRDQWDFPAMTRMLCSEDAVEGPVAFAEKRAPTWRGR